VQPAQGTIVAERFRLERRLGQGGMGAVWLARHLSLDIPCAVKFLHPEAADQATVRARFEREAKAAAQLRSPNVVQVLDHGVWQDMPFIAMELLEGEDLQQRLRRMRALDARDTFAIVAQVARALTKAHALGLVHRDLKPGNIFLVRDDDREVAKVLDFGVAKNTLDVRDSHTQTGALMGTPYYMSPEQARGVREVDHRSDLWALGVIAYQCLLGRLPFPGEALGDLFMKIIVEPLPIPSQFAAVPPGFDLWWARAAAREPAQRFQTAKEMADSLGIALGISVGLTDAYASSQSGRQQATMALPPGPASWPMHTPMATPSPATPMPGYQSGAPVPGVAAAYPAPSSVPTFAPQTASPIAAEIPQATQPKGGNGWVVAVVAVLVVVALGGGGALMLLGRGRSAPASAAQASPASTPSVAATAPTAKAAAAPQPTDAAPAAPAPTEPVNAPPTATASAAPAPKPWPGRPVPPPPPKAAPVAPPKPAATPQHDDGI
jgi:serine/threonine-protein kinase